MRMHMHTFTQANRHTYRQAEIDAESRPASHLRRQSYINNGGIHTYIHTYMNTRIHTKRENIIQARIHTNIGTHTHRQSCNHVYTHKRTYNLIIKRDNHGHTYSLAGGDTYIQSGRVSYRQSRRHTHNQTINTHTCMHTQTRMQSYRQAGRQCARQYTSIHTGNARQPYTGIHPYNHTCMQTDDRDRHTNIHIH